MKIKRIITEQLKNSVLSSGKIVILYGARQVGKTTLVKDISESLNLNSLYISADESDLAEIFSSQSLQKMKEIVGNKELLIIDEAQRIENIGINLKILHDNLKYLKIIVTGSSSLDLANKISEPLTGRTRTYHLYPISVLELQHSNTDHEIKSSLENLLIYGMYPEIVQYESLEEKKQQIEEIEKQYLYKDALEITNIKYSKKLKYLMKLLSFQIGSEVSINEISTQLGISRDTINDYIDLLEKNFILFRLGGFSRNSRKEITKNDKIYFYDLGIRNAVIGNFHRIEDRNDIGQLWENFLIIERLKLLKYSKASFTQYFWRLWSGAELDYVEELNSELYGYEFKFRKDKFKVPKSWQEKYNTSAKLINKENFIEFLRLKESF
ncbi:ATP-binding protein [Candidatus Dojkabacteria bacterium]|nr:ATP-binding protein [Candidatus Dojkabacteria bacterium]